MLGLIRLKGEPLIDVLFHRLIVSPRFCIGYALLALRTILQLANGIEN